MPYLIFLFGILVGLYALYRFFLKANPDEVKNLIRISISLVYGIIILYFALSNRIIISLALLVLYIPFIISYYRSKLDKQSPKGDDKENDKMS